MKTANNIIVAVTGASGAAYAQRLIQCLAASGVGTHLVISPYGRRLFADELNISPVTVESLVGRACEHVVLHNYNDLGSRLASGSFRTSGMVVCPCSSNSLGAMAAGLGDNLINRAAQVALKERRRLVLVYREMPMSLLDLQNATRLTEAGAVFCPANPGYYMLPETISDIVDFVVGKILDLVDIEHDLDTRWAPDSANNAPAE